MNFKGLLKEIEYIIDLKLNSIRKGAEITLTGFDYENQRIFLKNSQGIAKSRPFSELEKIWNVLCAEPAIHVESVLHGSGSSRNQPETIFANLPFVEWFYLERKKHLCLCPEPTHDYGTLKQVNSIKCQELIEKLKNSSRIDMTIIIIPNDISETHQILSSVTGIKVEPINKGVYQQIIGRMNILLISSEIVNGIKPGTYPVIPSKAYECDRFVNLLGKKYGIIDKDGFKAFIKY